MTPMICFMPCTKSQEEMKLQDNYIDTLNIEDVVWHEDVPEESKLFLLKQIKKRNEENRLNQKTKTC